MQRSELCSEKEFLYKFSQHIVALENRKSIRATIFSRLRSLSIDNSFALKYMKSEELGHDLGHFLGTGIFNHLKSSLHSKPSIREKYGHIETHLGQGTNGTVLLSQKINGDKQHLFAIKEFRKKQSENEKDYIKKVTSEFCISSSLHHQNVIETVDLIRNDKSQLCEVMEYCPGGDLCSLILNSVLSLDESNCFFAQLINGVAYIHSMGVAHKDFGEAEVFKSPYETEAHKSHVCTGSEPYQAPEEFIENPDFDPRLVDIWATGIIYISMVQNKIPWKRAEITDNHYKFYLDNRHTQNGFELIDKLSPGARDLIKLILEPNPELRIKMEMILVDEWFSKQAQSCKACCEKGLKERDFYDGALDLSLDSMSVKSKSRSSSMTPKRKVNIVQGSLTPAECHHNRHHPIVSEEYF